MRLKQDIIVSGSDDRPDLTSFTETADEYAVRYSRWLQAREVGEHEKAWDCRVCGSWGLIAKGRDGVRYATQMLSHEDPAVREDGAAILGEIGDAQRTGELLLQVLKQERDLQVYDTIIAALGELRTQTAIPVVAEIIKDKQADEDSRWNAAKSLGLIVGRRFDHESDPVAAASKWLADNSFE